MLLQILHHLHPVGVAVCGPHSYVCACESEVAEPAVDPSDAECRGSWEVHGVVPRVIASYGVDPVPC